MDSFLFFFFEQFFFHFLFGVREGDAAEGALFGEVEEDQLFLKTDEEDSITRFLQGNGSHDQNGVCFFLFYVEDQFGEFVLMAFDDFSGGGGAMLYFFDFFSNGDLFLQVSE